MSRFGTDVSLALSSPVTSAPEIFQNVLNLELIFLGATLAPRPPSFLPLPSDASRGLRLGLIGSHTLWHAGQVIDDPGTRSPSPWLLPPESPAIGSSAKPRRLPSSLAPVAAFFFPSSEV